MTKHFRGLPAALVAHMAAPPAAVLGTVRAEGRDPASVLAELSSQLKRITGEQRDRIDDLATRQLDLEQQFATGRRGADAGPSGWGSQVTASDTFRSLQGAAAGTHRFRVRQAITSVGTSAGALITPDTRTDPIALPRRRLTVRDLLNPGSTTSNMVQYGRQITRTNNAGMVSEGGQKPESVFEWEQAEAPVRTIAHWVPVSRQAMDDAPMLESVIDGELRYGLDEKEEAQLLQGDGTGQNLSGLVIEAAQYAAPFTIASETYLDTVLLADAQLAGTEIEANGVIVNSLDWKRMQATKDSQGRYIGGGPFLQTPDQLWRLAVVPTNAMPEGEFLVGDFRRAATIYDRMEVEVLISSEDRDNFVKNMLTVRAEKRLALAVTMPAAMVWGAFGAAVSGA